jgi:hypothetical protein
MLASRSSSVTLLVYGQRFIATSGARSTQSYYCDDDSAGDLPPRMSAAARLEPEPEVHLRADRTQPRDRVAVMRGSLE